MKKTKKLMLILLVAVLSLAAFGIGAFAVTYVDGNSTSYDGGSGTKLTGHNYDVFYTSDATIGYRITLLRKNSSGSFDRLGSTDAYYKGNSQYPTSNYNCHLKITAAGKTYYNVDKYTMKSIYSGITKVAAQSLGTIGQKYTSAYSYYYGTTASLGVAVPSSASGAKAWAFSEDKMNKVLSKFGSYTMANLKANDYILMEPLYSVTINGTGYSITVTEMALLGRILYGDSSTGAEGNYSGYDWNTICKYTNMNYPKELYTSDSSSHSDLGIADGSALTSKATFKTIFNNGYGLLIAWNKNPHVLTIRYDCYNSSPTISSTTYKMDTSDYNRIKLKSDSSYFAQKVKYDNNVTLKTLSTFGITPQTGKHFVGWSINGTVRNGGGTYSASTLYSGVSTANASVWASAKFENNTYTVEYYVDGTKQTSLTQSCTYGTSYTFKSLPSIATGNHYTNTSWHLSSATGTAKTPGGSFSNLTATNGGTIKLYTTTAKNTYTVEYYLDGVKQTSLTQSCTYGTSYSYKDVPESTVTNNKVSGWYSGNTYADKGTSYKAGNSFSNLTATNGGTVKRYAYSYVVIYYRPNGGTVGNEDYTTNSSTTILKASDNSYIRFYMYYGTTLTSSGLCNASTFGLTKTGYAFSFWMATTDNSKLYDQTTQYEYNDFKDYANTSGSVILLAKWKPNEYTMEYYLDGVKQTSLTQSCKYGTSYSYQTVPASTVTNNKVSGWYHGNTYADKGSSFSAENSFSNLTPTNGGTIKRYAYSYVVIYYKPNGGTVGNSKFTTNSSNIILNSSDSSYVRHYMYYGSKLISSGLYNASSFGLTKTGYVFSSWMATADNSKLYDQTTQYEYDDFKNYANTSGSVILLAKWNPNEYTVEYYVDGAKKDSLTQNCKYGTSYTYQSLPTVSTGKHYTNTSWHLSSATGTEKNPGDSFSNLTSTNGEIIKCYATTDYNTYVVKYYLDGTEQTSLAQTCTYGTSYNYKVLPTKTGYSIAGWNNKSDMTGTNYSAGTSFNNLTSSNGGTVKRYAKSTANGYKVEYYVDGVLQSNLTQKCQYGTSYTYPTLPAIATGKHYTNTNWHLSSATGTAKTPGDSFSNLASTNGGTIKYYATTDYNTYVVKYYLDGTEKTALEQSCVYGTSYSYQKLPTITGSTVIGWNDKEDLSGTDFSPVVSYSNLTATNGGTVKRYAKSTTNSYTVKYYLDGVLQNSLTQTCLYDSTYDYRTLPTKTGYTVTGWNSKSDMTGTAYTSGASFTKLSSTNGGIVNRYAKSSANEYKVEYYVDGILQSTLTQNCQYGTSYTYPTLPTATTGKHYTNTSWHLSSATGTAKTPGGSFSNLTTANNATVKFYATTEYDTYTVKYFLDGTEQTSLAQTCTYGKEYYYKALPTKTGYSIAGWNNKSDMSGTTYSANSSFGNLTVTNGGTVYRYAKSTPISYKVQYYVDGVLQSSMTQNCQYGVSYSYKNLPSKTGYTISGWNSKSDMTGTIYSANNSFSNLSVTNGSVIKRYAVFSPISYKVRFNSNGGTGNMNVQTFLFDEEKNLSENMFVKDGYEFVQWNTKTDGTGTAYDDAQKVKNLSSVADKVIDLYAQWKNTGAILSLKAITPNAPYREKTEVISSFNIINSSVNDCKPDDNISVVFKVLKNSTIIKTVTVNNVFVPANEKNLLYFKWTVPELTSETIKITAEIVDGDNHYGQISKTYSTCEYEISQTPDTQYEATAPEDFVMKSVPTETDSTLNWYVWDYSDGAFVKKTYKANLNGNTVTIKPAASANSWKDNGKTYTKSGYGIEINVTDTVSTSLSGSCTDIQYVSATFPEFGYATVNTKYRTLEKVAEKWVFRTNEDYGRIHFTPLWFPDGSYIASVNISDCWTPAGMLRRTVNSNELIIEGTAYDDWWVD